MPLDGANAWDRADSPPAGPVGLDRTCGLLENRVKRLPDTDLSSGEPIHRYEDPRQRSTIHVDVVKFGNIFDGGTGMQTGKQGNVSPWPPKNVPITALPAETRF